MNRKGKKELLNNWQNMSIEERENKLAELESSLSEKKFKKIVNSIQKIENSLKDDSFNEEVDNHEDNESETQSSSDENYVESFESDSSNDELINHNEYMTSNEEDSNEDEELKLSDENDSNDDFLDEEKILNSDANNSNEEDELNQNWIIDENELNVETNYDNDTGLDNGIFESESSEEYVPVNFESLKIDSKKEQIGSNERAWNKNKDIIYSQEELIYRLSNSSNISDEEYKMLLISAQKKIEFIQLLIEKSRVKNAAYSYDFLNSMCWRVDKALKTFLAANKR